LAASNSGAPRARLLCAAARAVSSAPAMPTIAVAATAATNGRGIADPELVPNVFIV